MGTASQVPITTRPSGHRDSTTDEVTTIFYCDDCAHHHEWPLTPFKSHGLCEMCNKTAVCNDTPSVQLPQPRHEIQEEV